MEILLKLLYQMMVHGDVLILALDKTDDSHLLYVWEACFLA